MDVLAVLAPAVVVVVFLSVALAFVLISLHKKRKAKKHDASDLEEVVVKARLESGHSLAFTQTNGPQIEPQAHLHKHPLTSPVIAKPPVLNYPAMLPHPIPQIDMTPATPSASQSDLAKMGYDVEKRNTKEDYQTPMSPSPKHPQTASTNDKQLPGLQYPDTLPYPIPDIVVTPATPTGSQTDLNKMECDEKKNVENVSWTWTIVAKLATDFFLL